MPGNPARNRKSVACGLLLAFMMIAALVITVRVRGGVFDWRGGRIGEG